MSRLTPVFLTTTDGGVRDTEMSVTADTSPVMDTGVKAAVMDTGDGTGLDLSAVTVAVIAEVGTSAEPAIVERALRLGLDGLSARRISEAMAPDGPSRTPVAAWLKAAKQRSDYATAIRVGRRPAGLDRGAVDPETVRPPPADWQAGVFQLSWHSFPVTVEANGDSIVAYRGSTVEANVANSVAVEALIANSVDH